MWIPMKVMLMKWRTNNIKRCTAFLLVLLMLGMQVIDLPQVVFADGISGNRWVSYRVDQAYDKDDKSLTITVDADEERSEVTIESMILPDGTVVHGNQAVYKVYSNGNYKFSVEYTVDAATATSSTAAGSTTAGSTVKAATATGSTASPSEAAGKRKKRDIDVVVNAFPAVFAAGDVTINDTANFPDPEFQKYLRDNCDPNNDGILSLDEQLAVSTININSADLIDMGGLQFFPNLRRLEIKASLDYTKPEFKLDISQNTLLAHLVLGDMIMSRLDLSRSTNLLRVNLRNISRLNQLDFRQNPRLTSVTLTSMSVHCDFSQNLNLTDLIISHTFTGLDISNNKKLKKLRLDNVHLDSLDISGNENLSDLYMNAVTCNNTTVDTSKNPLLKSYYVRFNGAGNTPSSVDVSHNRELESLYVDNIFIGSLDLSNNPKLSTLFTVGGGLTSLDVSNNPELRMITVQGSQFTGIGSQLTSLDVSNNPRLNQIRLAGNQLTSLDVSSNPGLQVIGLAGNQLTSLDVSNNPSLNQIDLAGNQLTSLDVSNNPSLIFIDLTGNQLTDLDLSNNPRVLTLRISNNNLSTLDLTKMFWLNGGDAELNDQTVEGFYHVKDSNYIVDFNEIVGSSNLGNVASVSQNGSTIPYDPATGIAMAPMVPDKNITYTYHTGNAATPLMNVVMSLQGRYLINATAGAGGDITRQAIRWYRRGAPRNIGSLQMQDMN